MTGILGQKPSLSNAVFPATMRLESRFPSHIQPKPWLVLESGLLLLRLVAWQRLAVLIKLAAGPEQAAGDEIEVNRILHRAVVMTERRAEHASGTVVVRPDDVVVFLCVLTEGGGQWHDQPGLQNKRQASG